MSGPVGIRRRAGSPLIELVFDVPDRRNNVLSTSLIEALDHALDALADERAVGVLLVRSGKEAVFLTGPDPHEVAALDDAAIAVGNATRGQGVVRRLEQLPYPVVAAIDGPALGSGLELALSCRHRIASTSPATRLGLPQVCLGMLPALGGTQRLPRVIGVRRAVPMLLDGTVLTAEEALASGLVDAVGPAHDFLTWAREWALALATNRRGRTASGSVVDGVLRQFGPLRDLYLLRIERQLRRSTGSLCPAPLTILSSVREGLRRPLDEGLEVEAGLAGALVVSAECKGFIRTHLTARNLERSPEVDLAMARPVARVGVCGAGESGGALAAHLARCGVEVRLHGSSLEALRQAMQAAGTVAAKGDVSAPIMQTMRRIAPALTDRGLVRNDVLIWMTSVEAEGDESALVDLESRAADTLVVIAVSDVGRPSGRLARRLQQPQRLVAVRFAGSIGAALVEVVRADGSDEAAVATVVKLLRRIGRFPLVVNDGPGYLVGRVRAAMVGEAVAMLLAGVTVASVDGALVDFGMLQGPLAQVDALGIDVMQRELENLAEVHRDRFAPSSLIALMVERGMLGRRVGRGFYAQSGARSRVNREVADLVKSLAGSAPSTVVPSRGVVQERLILAMVNEAAHAVHDGVVGTAAACDLATVLGLGFPAFRGGLFGFATSLGGNQVLAALDRLQVQHGERFRPAPGLPELLTAARPGRPGGRLR